MDPDECDGGLVCGAEMHEDPPASCTDNPAGPPGNCESDFELSGTCPQDGCTYTASGPMVETGLHICMQDTAPGQILEGDACDMNDDLCEGALVCTDESTGAPADCTGTQTSDNADCH
eukprot:COSAG06_NODE_37995_length_428_cov_1.580547_1_plen_117_part_01